MAEDNYKPLVVFQGALVARLDGTLQGPRESSYIKVAQPNFNLLYFYPDDTSPQAVARAVAQARHRHIANPENISSYAHKAEAAFDMVRHRQANQMALRDTAFLDTAQKFQNFGDLKSFPPIAELRRQNGDEAVAARLLKKYPGMDTSYYKENPKTEADRLRNHMSQYYSGPDYDDVTASKCTAFYQAFGVPEEPDGKSYRAYISADTNNNYAAMHDVVKALIRKRLDGIAANPDDFARSLAPQLPAFRLGFIKSTIQNLGLVRKNAESLHDRSYPAAQRQSMEEALENAIAGLPERSRQFLKAIDPEFYIADTNRLHKKARRGVVTLGTYFDNIIYLSRRSFDSSDLRKTLFEEVTHAIHDYVAKKDNTEAFAQAYREDVKSVQSKRFFFSYASKNLERFYADKLPAVFGSEVMAALAAAEQTLIDNGQSREQARAEISKNMPRAGALYAAYCVQEDAAYSALASPLQATGQGLSAAGRGFRR